jgi:hypothetical protein
MVREPAARRGLVVVLVGLAALLVAAVVGGQATPTGDQLYDFLLLAPAVLVVFAGLALVAPLVAGGGNELYPEGQLVAYPVTSRTTFLTGLLIAPLNLAWLTQVIMLVFLTAAVVERSARVVFSVATTLVYVALVTVTAQALAWTSVGVRGSRPGRLTTRALLAILGAGGIGIVLSGHSSDVLDRAPTTRIVFAAIAGSQGRWDAWASTTLVLLMATVAALVLGVRACDWAMRRPPPPGRPELAPVMRRAARRSPFLELVAVDWFSVWRSTPLRRGLLVLAVLPGGVALLADPTWPSLALLPGLVAAGAGLLFGVNAFCLDGNGAVWVATLPHPPRWSLLAKLVVVAATCLGTVTIALLVAAVRVDAPPTLAEAIAVLGSALASSAVVVATCAKLSVRHPHKADLRGPRDTPAPPATMAAYSARLAFGTTWVGLLLAGLGAAGSPPAAVAGVAAVLLIAVRSLMGTLTRWDSVTHRAQVVTKVSYG